MLIRKQVVDVPEVFLLFAQMALHAFFKVVLSRTHVSIQTFVKVDGTQLANFHGNVSADRDFQDVDANHVFRLEPFSLYHFNISLSAFRE
jgi:hypothetical protein